MKWLILLFPAVLCGCGDSFTNHPRSLVQADLQRSQGVSAASAADNWGDAPADLTNSEYLDLLFKLKWEQREVDSPNAFKLVHFSPSSSPRDALVIVVQAWSDVGVQPQDLRALIRKWAEVYSVEFETLADSDSVRKRWTNANPKRNLVIKHVRSSDVHEVIAVTFDGRTAFDDDAISKAGAEVTARGVAWDW